MIEAFVLMIVKELTLRHKLFLGKISEKNLRNIILSTNKYHHIDASYNLILVTAATFFVQYHSTYFPNILPLLSSADDLLLMFPSFTSSKRKGIEAEIDILLQFTNVMNSAVRVFTSTKKFLLDIVTFVVERKLRAYSTGGGANAPTERRLEIIEHVLALNNITKVKRCSSSSSSSQSSSSYSSIASGTPTRSFRRLDSASISRTDTPSPLTVTQTPSIPDVVDGLSNGMKRLSTSSVLTIDTTTPLPCCLNPTPSRPTPTARNFFPIYEEEENDIFDDETLGSTLSVPSPQVVVGNVAVPFPPLVTVGMFHPCPNVSDMQFTFSNLVNGVDQPVGQCVIQSNNALLNAHVDMSVTPCETITDAETVTISFTFVRSVPTTATCIPKPSSLTLPPPIPVPVPVPVSVSPYLAEVELANANPEVGLDDDFELLDFDEDGDLLLLSTAHEFM